MGRIAVMSEVLASQVAAGEVVERPASVAKELVENSLDAGATRVDVLIRRGGVALIKVVDNGSGMSREDALLCLERHATSKLRTSEDLAGILTLGFRGEAIPSIASVSQFSLHTREPEAIAGTCIQVEGGTVTAVEDSGESPGTQMEVRNLFFNVPARRKFLKAESTEFAHIEQHLRTQALAHPHVAFSLTHDERLVFQLSAGKLLDRIRQLFGADVAERLLEIPERKEGNITVSGYLGESSLFRPTRSSCLTFLNKRPVEAMAFSQAFRAAYGEAMPRGQHPVAVLNITIPPTEVDVNVHPAKREVRFVNSMAVQANLTTILAQRLRHGRGMPAPSQLTRAVEDAEDAVPSVVRQAAPAAPAAPVARWTPPVRQTELPLAHERPEGFQLAPQRVVAATPAPQPIPERKADPILAQNPYRMLGLLHREYVVMESEEGLVLLDFRAAWERILFEEARQQAAESRPASQKLLLPVTVALGPREFDLIKRHFSQLESLGIHAEEFGPLTLKVDAVPTAFSDHSQAESLIHQLVDDFAKATEKTALQRLDLDALAAIVSAQAAKRKVPGSLPELDAIVCRLLACEMPYCDPAGRPTMVQMSFPELARKFGRRG
jgi:DNA mismatch repair protein MutL